MLTYAGKTVPNSRNPIINEVIHLYGGLKLLVYAALSY
jgi:hypothetical protein